VRFLMMSNDTPTFSDRSGALGGRMIYLKFDQSFYGREDVSLTDKLLHELPGILNWALDGLERLDGRGRFTEPASGQAEAEAVRRLSDPDRLFPRRLVRDRLRKVDHPRSPVSAIQGVVRVRRTHQGHHDQGDLQPRPAIQGARFGR
jgi:hypothetical protein